MNPGAPPTPKKFREARYVVNRVLLAGARGPQHRASLLRLLTGKVPHAAMLVGQVCRLCSESRRGSDTYDTWSSLADHIAARHSLIRKALEEEMAWAGVAADDQGPQGPELVRQSTPEA